MGNAKWPRALAADDRSIRLSGVVLYAAVVAATWWLLPEALPFAVPAAALGVVLHTGMRKPWLGLAGFCLLFLVVPAVVYPSLFLEAFTGADEVP